MDNTRAAINDLCREHGEKRALTAIHEAGHAVTAHAFGGIGISAEIVPSKRLERLRLYGEVGVQDCSAFDEEDDIGQALSGRTAEIEAARICPQLENDDERHGGRGPDLSMANGWLSSHRRKYSGASADRLKRNSIRRSQRLVKANMGRIVYVAGELLRAGRIDATRMKNVLRDAPALRK